MVDLGPARDLTLSVALEFHGFAVVVTRPPPNDAPITTRGMWQRSMTDGQPYGEDLRNAYPRRVLVLPKTVVPSAPRGTVVTAPERLGGTNVNWRIDGDPDPAANDLWIVAVTRIA